MRENRVTTNLESIMAELTILGYKELPLEHKKQLGIINTFVFASLEGNIATIKMINKECVKWSLKYRNVSPMSKGGNKLEYRVTIEDKTYAIHKLVALTFPEFAGKWEYNMDVHHLNGKHLDNRPTNLICLDRKLHNKLHSLLDEADDLDLMLSKINTYLFECRLYDEEITIEGLEELVYG